MLPNDLDRPISYHEIRGLHLNYLNDGLVKLLGFLKFDRSFVRAGGTKVWDSEGLEYLDFLAGYGAINLGHNPKGIIETIKRALDSDLANMMQTGLGIYPAILAQKLSELSKGHLKRTFFSNSGTETIECALKFARAATGRPGFVSLVGGFHGKSLGSLSVMGNPHHQKPFEPLIPGCRTVPFGDLGLLEKELKKKDVAAFVIEPVMGEGGILVHPNGYLEEARKLCRHYGTLLILDEIQCGMGRTGRFFAYEHWQFKPDIVCLAKSLSAGLVPIGATLCTERVWQKAMGGIQKCLRHTSTFGGNSLACIVGMAAIEMIEQEDLLTRAEEMGQILISGLTLLKSKFHKIIKDVRGLGLMIGIEFQETSLIGKIARDYLAAMMAAELLNSHQVITADTLNNGRVLRVEPPLVVSEEEIKHFVKSLEQVLVKFQTIHGLVSRTILKSGLAKIGLS
jgi:putrescine aminotransferase